jgi:hypothetical protein
MTDCGSTLATKADANARQSPAALRVGTITAIGTRIVISNIMEQLPVNMALEGVSTNTRYKRYSLPADFDFAQKHCCRTHLSRYSAEDFRYNNRWLE